MYAGIQVTKHKAHVAGGAGDTQCTTLATISRLPGQN